MEIKYTIAGADGQTYGPVSLQELQTWIRDGRVAAQTNVLRSDVNAWHAASQYQELTFSSGAAAPPPLSSTTYSKTVGSAGQFPELEKKIKSGASWFYWIAGFSLLNGLTAVFTAKARAYGFAMRSVYFSAAFGLGVGGDAGKIVGISLVILLCGLLVVCGVLGYKKHTWAFVLGLVIYGLDGLLVLIPPQNWLSLAFHAWAFFGIFSGLKANLDFKKQTGL